MNRILYFLPAFLVMLSCNQQKGNTGERKDFDKIISIEGEKKITEDLLVPENTLLQIAAGSFIICSEDVKIIVEGTIRAEGTSDKPVIFTSTDEDIYWRGIEIKGMDDIPDTDKFWNWIEFGDKKTEDEFFNKIESGNLLEYCNFSNTAPTSKAFERQNKWMGTIEAYNTRIRVSNCSFNNILYFGGVLTQRSLVIVNNSTFDDVTMHKAINSTDRSVGLFYGNTIIGHRSCNARCADGIWTKKFTGLIAGNYVEAVADDGIDTDDSRTVIYDNKIKSSFDDGIDIDNKGLSLIIKNEIDSVFENGILISDGSEVVSVENKITGSSSGLTLRDGAEVVTNGMIITHNEIGVQLYQNIPTAVSKPDFENIKLSIGEMTVDEIYEEEYIEGTEDAQDLINMLDNYYEEYDNFYLFKKEKFTKLKKLDPLKKVFKIVGVTGLEYIYNNEIKYHPLNKATKNGLFLSGALVKDNVYDLKVYHDYNMKMEDSEFTSDAIKKEILENCKCDENHKCEIIDKLNTSGVEINARKIIKRIHAL